MICFQFVSLTYWYSPLFNYSPCNELLWFAFNLYLWHTDIHLAEITELYWPCCDLLSICIFDILIFTSGITNHHLVVVVICFQFVSLTYWYSPIASRSGRRLSLWFAFNLYLWHTDIHLQVFGLILHFGCDLLSICIFDILIFTLNYCKNLHSLVVICFQFVSLTYWYSPVAKINLPQLLLWFAFNLYLWHTDIHLKAKKCCGDFRCDLLSICIFDILIFTLRHNAPQRHAVVICFQFVSLTYWYSPEAILIKYSRVLWFAFNLYLWHTDIHLSRSQHRSNRGCDLLSICIFDILIFT